MIDLSPTEHSVLIGCFESFAAIACLDKPRL